MILPLYKSRQLENTLLSWIRGKGSFTENGYHEFLKNHWEKEIFPGLNRKVNFESFWNSALHDGVITSGS